jgi:hypothetical protein
LDINHSNKGQTLERLESSASFSPSLAFSLFFCSFLVRPGKKKQRKKKTGGGKETQKKHALHQQKGIHISFLYAELDDSYEYSMSRHYDEATGKEVKICAAFSLSLTEREGERTILITCNIVLPFDKTEKKGKNKKKNGAFVSASFFLLLASLASY